MYHAPPPTTSTASCIVSMRGTFDMVRLQPLFNMARLPEEIDCARLYLQLQQRRFADRLAVVVPERDTFPSVWVPSLLLQPLIENAVIHGLAHHDAGVEVRIEVQVADEALLLRVVNTMAAPRPLIASAQNGIGIKNLRERLAIQFGGRAVFSAGPGPDNQWIAEIRVPLLRDGT